MTSEEAAGHERAKALIEAMKPIIQKDEKRKKASRGR